MPASPLEKKPWYKRYSSGDITLAAAGIALALICALFPWYIFFNQEQFGIRALTFEGDVGNSAGAGSAPQSRLLPEPMTVPELAPAADDARFDSNFDSVATGTVPTDSIPESPPPSLDKQPFPSPPGDFRLIHVANGRAMIEDDRGIWVVQPGSTLPDNSRVSLIEQRDGRWVLVTDADRVVVITD